MEELNFSDYLILCSDFEKNPEDTSKLEEIEDFISQIEIREYLPLKEKEMVVMDIITALSSDFDAPATAAFLENGRVTKGLLAYCVNLTNDLPIMSLNYFAPDAIYEYGLYDAVVARCEADYKRLLRMIDDVVNATNIYRITQTAALFNEESYQDWIKSMKELKDTVDSEAIQGLLSLVSTESEEGKDLLDTIREMALEQTNKEFANDAAKFEKAAEFQESSKTEESIDVEEEETKHVS